jgi:two-component system chemotaxis sensor kinase CheA
MIGQDPEMLQMFLEEAQEHLGNLEPDLLQLEETKEEADQELINRIFRAVHSLKGSAGFFGFEKITSMSHVMENLLSLVRDGKLKPTSEMITSLLAGSDKLVQMINDIDESEFVEIEKEVEEINAFIRGDATIGKKVKLKPKDDNDFSKQLADQFEIELKDLKDAVKHGHFLYAVSAYTKKDMKDKGRTPLDYINNIQKLGTLIASYSDISAIMDLSSTKDSEIAFVFLFSSVLEPDLIALGLEVNEKQVKTLDLPELKEPKKETPKQKSAAPVEPVDTLDDSVKQTENMIPEPADVSIQEDEIMQEESEQEVVQVEETESVTSEIIEKSKAPSKKESSSQKETLRVNVAVLNDLMTLAGELVLARNQLIRMTNDIKKDIPGFASIISDIDMTTTNLQGKIMETRMQPISLVFNKFPRVIRDLSKSLDKKIQLEMVGGDVDLDKSIIEKLSDPLTHLIRNAADHGLETPGDRKRIGKSEEGSIWLKAYHEGGKVNIDVIDDGSGINPEKIKQKALEKGIVTEAELRRMNEKEVLNLIMAPGFSTAAKVTNVSGRGVGMDVVRNNIEKLGGTISIESQINEGSRFNLKLPLTLAIIPSLIITVQNMNFAIPQSALKELVRLKKGDNVHKIEKVNNAPVLRLRNKLLPIVYLADVLGLSIDKDERETIRILVLQQDENEFGLVVDEIFDSEEIVVKSIPRFFKQSQCYSGTTIMGDGSVALILDINGITSKSNLQFTDQKAQAKADEKASNTAESEVQSLLMFENAKDEIFALNLDLIKRIEKLSVEDIEKVGEKEYIEHEGNSLRVIRMEEFLPVRSPEEESKDLYVIIPHLVENPIGIIAHKIIDAVDIDTQIDTQNIVAKGLIGSALLENQIVLFPDIYEIVDMAEPERSGKYHSHDNAKFKILLVEDTPFFRALEKQYIESAGYIVETAFDGLDGLKKLKEKDFDLIISDIIMPRLDGFEFIRNIKKDPLLKKIPTIALTTLNNTEAKTRAEKSGFDDFEVKVNKENLLMKIASYLNA